MLRWSLKERLQQEGYEIREADSAAAAIQAVGSGVDLVLLDYRLPDGDGLSVLRQIKEQSPDTLVIMMTGFSTIETAVEAIKEGAYHYVNKPVNLDEVALLVEKALETSRLRREVRALRTAGHQHGIDAIIGTSRAMQRIKSLLARVSASPASTVLLTGETGTGKDLAEKGGPPKMEEMLVDDDGLKTPAPYRRQVRARRNRSIKAARGSANELCETSCVDAGSFLRSSRVDSPLQGSRCFRIPPPRSS